MIHLRRAMLGVLFLAAMPCTTSFAASRDAFVLMAGEAQWWPLAQTMSGALAAPANLSLLPTQGEGCISTVTDVMQQPLVDAAILPADCMAYVAQQKLLNNVNGRLSYVARLETLPLLVVTRRDFPTLTSLAGRRIATGHADSSAFAAGELLLGGMDLPFIRVPKSGADALAALMQGNADAVLLLGGLAALKDLDAKQFHVLGLTQVQGTALHYQPSFVPQSDLGGLAMGDVETLASALALVVKAAPTSTAQARKRDAFSKAFVAWAADTALSQHLSSQVPGLTRLKAAIAAVDQLAAAQDISSQPLQQGDGP
jgi:TRAP-type uncharacterized transport system substrate-binding protein